MRYTPLGRNAVIDDGDIGVAFQVLENPRDLSEHRPKASLLDWDVSLQQLGDLRVFPMGTEDNLPILIRDIVKNNNAAPGMLKKKVQMLWSKGPYLHATTFKDGMPHVECVDDPEVMVWLESWDFKNYFMQCSTDLNYMEGFFTKFIPTVGTDARPYINELQHCNPAKTRLATDKDREYEDIATHAVISTRPFGKSYNKYFDWKAYPVFDPYNVKPVRSVLYSSLYSFCQDIYAVPDILGVLSWLSISNDIPVLFEALSKNGVAAKYHIQSPQKYWDMKATMLEKRYKEMGRPYDLSVLAEYKKNLLRSITKVLSGIENTGKFLHTEYFYDAENVKLIEYGWKIDKIDSNIKEFVEAQIAISERSDFAVASGININPALANVDSNNRANSGSTLNYAINNHMATGVDMEEVILFTAVNHAIKINWPEKKCRMGFHRVHMKREEEKAPADRNINN
jgi:hypothetical protein